MDEMTLQLNTPITEEQYDAIMDIDFDNTDRIWFHTKHGKDVEFVKRKTGRWINVNGNDEILRCSECNYQLLGKKYHDIWMNVPYNFCPNCGADMEVTE